jgi:hypothetical protein
MSSRLYLNLIMAGLILLTIHITPVLAQGEYANTPVRFTQKNLGGPRMGITYLPGNTELVQKLGEHGIGSTISQFGWHFEWQVVPSIYGPSFVIELVPLLGGVEYSKVIPSITLAMGVRLPNGFEFGMGPNVFFGGEDVLHSSLVVVLGKTFNYGGVNLPINLAYITNPAGNRVAFIFGYAISKS